MSQRWIWGLCLLASVTFAATAGAEEKGAKITVQHGYAEFRSGHSLVVDGYEIRTDSSTAFQNMSSTSLDDIPVGWEISFEGRQQPDGSVLLTKISARPPEHVDVLGVNPKTKLPITGDIQSNLKQQSREDVAKWLTGSHGMFKEALNGEKPDGTVPDTDPQTLRLASLVRRLAPSFAASQIQVHVSDDEDWNALGMPDGNVIVSGALLRDMDDDELAIVVGHELAHVTNEHRRWQMLDDIAKKLAQQAARESLAAMRNPWVRVAALGGGALAWQLTRSAYSRHQEDDADRIGLRYAQRAGFDISKAPRVWRRFEAKYGNQNRVTSVFAGHSRNSDRAENLEKELATTYRGWSRTAQLNASASPAAGQRSTVVAAARVDTVATATSGRALTELPPVPVQAVAPKGARDSPAKSSVKPVTPSMTTAQVKKARGEPAATAAFEADILWTYADGTRIVFRNGLVKTVLEK